jgi:glycosyltransferase involved in cell wall biosynthesis
VWHGGGMVARGAYGTIHGLKCDILFHARHHAQPTVVLGMAYISVIIPSRLEGAFLENAIRSIRSQETVVGIDHGSTPPELRSVEFIESKGNNQAAALNAAVAHATGDFIAFLEDDDEWRPAFVKTALFSIRNIRICFLDIAYRRHQRKCDTHRRLPSAVWLDYAPLYIQGRGRLRREFSLAC